MLSQSDVIQYLPETESRICQKSPESEEATSWWTSRVNYLYAYKTYVVAQNGECGSEDERAAEAITAVRPAIWVTIG